MNISRHQHDGHLVLHLAGRLDLQAATDVRSAIESLAGTPKVVVDMADVSFVDSSGLGALVAGYKAVRRDGGDFKLARVGAQALKLLQLTTLDRVFSIVDELPE